MYIKNIVEFEICLKIVKKTCVLAFSNISSFASVRPLDSPLGNTRCYSPNIHKQTPTKTHTKRPHRPTKSTKQQSLSNHHRSLSVSSPPRRTPPSRRRSSRSRRACRRRRSASRKTQTSRTTLCNSLIPHTHSHPHIVRSRFDCMCIFFPILL